MGVMTCGGPPLIMPLDQAVVEGNNQHAATSSNKISCFLNRLPIVYYSYFLFSSEKRDTIDSQILMFFSFLSANVLYVVSSIF